MARSFAKIYRKHFADGEIFPRGNILGKRADIAPDKIFPSTRNRPEIYRERKNEKTVEIFKHVCVLCTSDTSSVVRSRDTFVINFDFNIFCSAILAQHYRALANLTLTITYLRALTEHS